MRLDPFYLVDRCALCGKESHHHIVTEGDRPYSACMACGRFRFFTASESEQLQANLEKAARQVQTAHRFQVMA